MSPVAVDAGRALAEGQSHRISFQAKPLRKGEVIEQLLAFFDAVAWPVAWVALATQLPQRTGVVGPMLIAPAVLGAVVRTRRALWENHRYRFTTWRWGRVAPTLVLIGAVMKLALAQ